MKKAKKRYKKQSKYGFSLKYKICTILAKRMFKMKFPAVARLHHNILWQSSTYSHLKSIQSSLQTLIRIGFDYQLGIVLYVELHIENNMHSGDAQ